MEHSPLLEQLKGGDRRSIGRVPLVVRDVLDNINLIEDLIKSLNHIDHIVRMRAADALEKISKKRPAVLTPFKEILMNAAADSEQQEVRWHVAQMLPRLGLKRKDLNVVISVLQGYLKDRSSIVKVCAMQALAELASRDRTLIQSVTSCIEVACQNGTPAMRARGRKLLSTLLTG